MQKKEIPFQVSLRILPSADISNQIKHSIKEINDKKELNIEIDNEILSANVDHIFNEDSSQNCIFESCVKPLLYSTFKGCNSTIISYGSSNSGKSYTIGLDTAVKGPTESGIFARIISSLFYKIETETSQTYKIFFSLFEIYSEELNDLLSNEINHELKIQSINNESKVINLTETEINNAETALYLFEKNKSKRKSKLSHILTFIIIEKDDEKGEKTRCKITLADLASSEKSSYDENSEKKAKNLLAYQGILSLKKVILALTSNEKDKFIPYVSSKLTNILKESFGGNAITLMLVCIDLCNPDLLQLKSTLSILNKAKDIKNHLYVKDENVEKKNLNTMVIFDLFE